MSIRAIPGKPGHFLNIDAMWVPEGKLPRAAHGGTVAIAPPELAQARKSAWQDEKRRYELAMRSTTDRRRRRRWRWRRRARGQEYAKLLATGPSSKRPVAITVTTPFRITETRHSARWDTVELK